MNSQQQNPQLIATLFVASALVISLGCRARDTETDRADTATANPDSNVWFVESSQASGIDFVHQRGTERNWLPEIMGGGAAWIDYDNDGDLDLYLIQSGELPDENNQSTAQSAASHNMLYRNQGDGTFEDVTLIAKVGDTKYGMGVAVGDYDGDGLPDIYVTNVGPNVLYRNRGDGTFEDVSGHAQVDHPGWGTAASFTDYDQDGHVDLLLVNYIRWSPSNEVDCRTGSNVRDYCSPLEYQAPAKDVLYRNRGDGTFEDVTHAVGLDRAYGNGLGAVVGDFNNDGLVDFYVANDGMPNQLWLQDEQHRFKDESLLRGCSVNHVGTAEAGMGVAVWDIENDGDLDLFMTHLGTETNTLYVNQGTYFEDRTARANLAAPSLGYTGFGLAVADFNHDGFQDIFVANGRVGRNNEALVAGNIFAEPNQLFVGGKDQFSEIANGGTALPIIENSRAAVIGDCDNDGDLDVVVVNNGGPAHLMINQNQTNNWIQFRSVRQQTLAGAKLQITTQQGTQWRQVGTTGGYLSSNQPNSHFGLGSAPEVVAVTAHWPDGTKETFGRFEVNQIHEIVKGSGQPTLDLSN